VLESRKDEHKQFGYLAQLSKIPLYSPTMPLAQLADPWRRMEMAQETEVTCLYLFLTMKSERVLLDWRICQNTIIFRSRFDKIFLHSFFVK